MQSKGNEDVIIKSERAEEGRKDAESTKCRTKIEVEL